MLPGSRVMADDVDGPASDSTEFVLEEPGAMWLLMSTSGRTYPREFPSAARLRR